MGRNISSGNILEECSKIPKIEQIIKNNPKLGELISLYCILLKEKIEGKNNDELKIRIILANVLEEIKIIKPIWNLEISSYKQEILKIL